LLAQKFPLPLGWQSQRRLQQFVYAFPAFSIHRSLYRSSRVAASQEEH
jgi:hypothetical protein